MKMPAFCYHRPATVEEAVGLLAEYGSDAKVLAGGQSLVPLLALRLSHPEHLVDIGRVDGLGSVDDGPAGFTDRRGRPPRRRRAVAGDGPGRPPGGRRHAPHRPPGHPQPGHGLRQPGPRRSRRRAAGRGAGDRRRAVARSAAGERRIPAADFFLGYLTSALDETELLTAVRFPTWPRPRRAGRSRRSAAATATTPSSAWPPCSDWATTGGSNGRRCRSSAPAPPRCGCRRRSGARRGAPRPGRLRRGGRRRDEDHRTAGRQPRHAPPTGPTWPGCSRGGAWPRRTDRGRRRWRHDVMTTASTSTPCPLTVNGEPHRPHRGEPPHAGRGPAGGPRAHRHRTSPASTACAAPAPSPSTGGPCAPA